jgi:hypothetical protein
MKAVVDAGVELLGAKVSHDDIEDAVQKGYEWQS